MRHTCRISLVLLLACSLRLPVCAAPSSLPDGTIALPCGLTDPAGRTAFLANAVHGIDAVDLATGDLLWTTTEAQRPLLVLGDRLYAQAGTQRNRLRILGFDLTNKGACVMESDPLVFPTWVVTGEAHGRSFRTRWRLEKTFLILAWEAEAWDPAQRHGEIGLAPRKHADGLARIDLETGEVEMRPAEKGPPPPALPRPPRILEKLAVRWYGVLSGKHVALVLEEEDPTPPATTAPAGPRLQSLVLRRWDVTTGKEEEPEVLGHGYRLMVQLTPDERFFCIRDAMPSPDALTAAQDHKKKYHVSIFSVKTGSPEGGISCEPGTQTIAVLGSRAYCLVAGAVHGPINRPGFRPRTLQVLDLKTDRLLWERPVEGKPFSPPGG